MSNPRLDAAYVAQVKAIRSRLEAFATARFAVGQHRDADAARFVRGVVPVVLAGRRQVSALTDSYLALVLADTLGTPVPPRGPIDTAALRGVDAAEVYQRPYTTVRYKLFQGLSYDAAVSAGAARLVDIVLTDMQLAKTNTSHSVLSRTSGIEVYMRTLTGDVNCALCYIASTQRYFKEDLMPIHPGCDCGVLPIADNGEQVINPSRLRAAHEAVEERFGEADSSGRNLPGVADPDSKDYTKALIVQEHGEMGPVLAVRGQHFTGKSVMDG